MTARLVVHHRDDFKSVFGVKGRGLEAERHQDDLAAASPAGFLFRSAKQPRSQALVTPFPGPGYAAFRRPIIGEFPQTAPGIPPHSGDDWWPSSLTKIASHPPSAMPVAAELNS